jgi:arylsulfatase A-like enzyme
MREAANVVAFQSAIDRHTIRSTSMKPLLIVFPLAACLMTGALVHGAGPARPNIVLIVADDLGYGDLRCYNRESDLATPHLDSLAEKGVRFSQFYAASNVCAPSRRALLTGRYPSRLGEWAEAYRTTPDDTAVNPQDEPCFPLFLKQAGYMNGMFGKWNIGSVNGISTPDAQGFDTWIASHHNASHFGHHNCGSLDFWENGQPAPHYRGTFADDVFVDKAIDFIQHNRDKPFFVYLSLFTPHAPFQDPKDPVEEGRPDLAAYNVKGAPSTGPPSPADRPVLRKMVEHVDQRIGDLLHTLADFGLEENTLVIFTSDNGGERACDNRPLSGYKQQMVEGGIRVPTMIKWPAVCPAGKVSGQAGIAMDLTRTILAAADAERHIPEARELDGMDLTPLLKGKAEAVERSLFWRRREWNQTENFVWAESCIQGNWKYLREFRQAAGYARTQQGTFRADGYLEALFNLKDDITETHNLAEQNPEKLAAMRREFERWRHTTVDRHRHYQIPVADQYGRNPF